MSIESDLEQAEYDEEGIGDLVRMVEKDREIARLQARLAALEEAAKPLLAIGDRLMSAIWDAHYGKGIHKDYANAVQKDIVEATYRVRATLSDSPAPTPPPRDGILIDESAAIDPASVEIVLKDPRDELREAREIIICASSDPMFVMGPRARAWLEAHPAPKGGA